MYSGRPTTHPDAFRMILADVSRCLEYHLTTRDKSKERAFRQFNSLVVTGIRRRPDDTIAALVMQYDMEYTRLKRSSCKLTRHSLVFSAEFAAMKSIGCGA